IRCVCGKKIGPDPRNFNQRVSLGRNDLLIRTFPNEVVESTEKNEVRDAALIAAAQKVEHYEIASYGTLVTLAEQLGYKKAAKLLAETLEEEKQTDVKLTDLAVGNINKKAEK
ncbi:DUF892 family protein, partial [Klebsiella pneumoniae]|uniref:YciE/YciF ferroxidase family protein n=1 Tax=Klebsiella pneumoniae TaxID=573 RepID=UPI001F2936F8